MLTLIHIRSQKTTSTDATPLTADYAAFERRRTARRQYMKAFGGMAIVVLLGAVFGRVPQDQAGIVIGLLLAPPTMLAIIQAFQWHRLIRRLEIMRSEVQTARKS